MMSLSGGKVAQMGIMKNSPATAAIGIAKLSAFGRSYIDTQKSAVFTSPFVRKETHNGGIADLLRHGRNHAERSVGVGRRQETDEKREAAPSGDAGIVIS
jgi:hypothetical protein